MGPFLSIQDAAEYLGVDYKTVYRLVRAGKLPAGKFGGMYRIRREDLEAYFQAQVAQTAGRSQEMAMTPTETPLKCGSCFRLLRSPREVAGTCARGGCSEPICSICWGNGARHCANHRPGEQERLAQAQAALASGEIQRLVTAVAARQLEQAWIARFDEKVRDIGSLYHPGTAEVLRVADWAPFHSTDDETLQLMQMLNVGFLDRASQATLPHNELSRYHIPAGGLGWGKPRQGLLLEARGGALSGVLIYSVANMDAGKWELWEYNFATGASRALFDWRTEVAYSGDYKLIAYYAWPPVVGSDRGIWIMNRDYTGEHLVIRGGAYPSFAPGNARLSAGDGTYVYVLNADGSGLRQIVEGEYPDWAPNSNWIAHRSCFGGACGIYLTDPDSGARQRLTEGGGDGQPAWSPNGQQIAYISKDDGNFEIYRIDATGANKVRLTNNPTSDGLPIWSPNGAWIAFRSDRGGGWAIYAMRADGSDVRKLVDAPVLPVWFFEKMGWRP